MDAQTLLAERFEANRPQLRAVAYRMLGSLSEADDAVQEAWLRLSRADSDSVANLGGWLTTVVSRVCLDMLRTRVSRRETPFEASLPDPVISLVDGDHGVRVGDPEHEALLAESVSLAVLVVLETLAPAERIAFVLHDMFAMPFDEIAATVGRSPAATRQLASRARRRVQGTAPTPDADLAGQRAVIDAFLAASRRGDFEALVALLDPNVVLRADTGGAGPRIVHGAATVARQALSFARLAEFAHVALVNGTAGMVSIVNGELRVVMGATIVGGKIVEMDILADRARLSQLALPRGNAS